jgi:hypothetical protein
MGMGGFVWEPWRGSCRELGKLMAELRVELGLVVKGKGGAL